LARAPVSKTGGWGFETLHPCQLRVRVGHSRRGPRPVCLKPFLIGGMTGVAVDPARFIREVRAEVAKVTWPSRRETMVTTGLVFAMAAAAAIFFFVIDQLVGLGMGFLFRGGI
jgi:preprotein translocase subunit SecE